MPYERTVGPGEGHGTDLSLHGVSLLSSQPGGSTLKTPGGHKPRRRSPGGPLLQRRSGPPGAGRSVLGPHAGVGAAWPGVVSSHTSACPAAPVPTPVPAAHTSFSQSLSCRKLSTSSTQSLGHHKLSKAGVYGKTVHSVGDIYGKAALYGDIYGKAVPSGESVYGNTAHSGDIYGKAVPSGGIYGKAVLPGDIYGKEVLPDDIYGKAVPSGDIYGKAVPSGDIYGQAVPSGDIYGQAVPSGVDGSAVTYRSTVNITLQPSTQPRRPSPIFLTPCVKPAPGIKSPVDSAPNNTVQSAKSWRATSPNTVPSAKSGRDTSPNTMQSAKSGRAASPNTVQSAKSGRAASPNTVQSAKSGRAASPNTVQSAKSGIAASPNITPNMKSPLSTPPLTEPNLNFVAATSPNTVVRKSMRDSSPNGAPRGKSAVTLLPSPVANVKSSMGKPFSPAPSITLTVFNSLNPKADVTSSIVSSSPTPNMKSSVAKTLSPTPNVKFAVFNSLSPEPRVKSQEDSSSNRAPSMKSPIDSSNNPPPSMKSPIDSSNNSTLNVQSPIDSSNDPTLHLKSPVDSSHNTAPVKPSSAQHLSPPVSSTVLNIRLPSLTISTTPTLLHRASPIPDRVNSDHERQIPIPNTSQDSVQQNDHSEQRHSMGHPSDTRDGSQPVSAECPDTLKPGLTVHGSQKPVLERRAKSGSPNEASWSTRRSISNVVYANGQQGYSGSPQAFSKGGSPQGFSKGGSPQAFSKGGSPQGFSKGGSPQGSNGMSKVFSAGVGSAGEGAKEERDAGTEGTSPQTVSDATRRLLDRWQLTATPVKMPTTVSLPGISQSSNSYLIHGSPSLPSLNLHTHLSSRNTDSARLTKRRDTQLKNTICLGPDPRSHAATPDIESARDVSSYHLRKDYGKNLERAWYVKMLQQEEKKASARKLNRLVQAYRLDGTTDEFYKSFYSSDVDVSLMGKESDDMSLDLSEDSDSDTADYQRNTSKVKSPFIRYASTDVLFSDQSNSSESDIDIIIRDDKVHDRRVRHKMRRNRKRKETKYQTLFSEVGERNIPKQVDENGDLIFLPDTEIRALRLRLKNMEDEEDQPFKESCTMAELKERIMNALAKLNGSTKKPRQKKKKSHQRASRGYGEYKEGSMYDRFLQEYGYLLNGYKIDPISESDESETEMAEESNANDQSKLPPISSANSSGSTATPTRKVSSRMKDIHLPKLNHTFQSSPFSTSGLLIGDTYYARGIGFSPSYKSAERQTTVQAKNGSHGSQTKKKKQRLQRILKNINLDLDQLLELTVIDKATVAPLTARRMSDPGVHMGKMLAVQKNIETEDELNARNQSKNENPKKKKKKKSKSKLTNMTSRVEGEGQGKKMTPRPQSSEGGPRYQEGGPSYLDPEFIDCKKPRRTASARAFSLQRDHPLTLRELTKDYDFPAKEIRLQVAERRLKRERLRRSRLKRKEEKELLDDEFRQERRHLIAAAKAEFLKQLEIARVNAKGDLGYHTEDENSKSEEPEAEGNVKSGVRFGQRGVRAYQPDYKELLRSPILPSGVNWGNPPRATTELTMEEIEEEADDISDLFLLMKDCRWIRWTKTQQRILDLVNQLEMDQL